MTFSLPQNSYVKRYPLLQSNEDKIRRCRHICYAGARGISIRFACNPPSSNEVKNAWSYRLPALPHKPPRQRA